MSFTFYPRALRQMVNGPAGQALLTKAATQVRDDARANAKAIYGGPRRGAGGRFTSGYSSAIAYELGSERGDIYADVGYMKHHPGFVLWWAEVGTKNQPAQPHLRPAVKPSRF